MSDPVKIPQLAIQVSKSVRTEESLATPDGTTEQGTTPSSFADVLKAKSLSPSVDSEVSEPGKVVALERNEAAAELMAAMFAGSSSLLRTPATATAEPADETFDPQAALDPAVSQPAIQPADGLAADSPILAVALPESATAAIPGTAPLPEGATVALPFVPPFAPQVAPNAVQAAVSPAPTSVSTAVPAHHESPVLQPVAGTPPPPRQIAAVQSAPAAAAANSAEGDKSMLTPELPEAKGEFRPLMERMSSHADGIAVQASATPQNAPVTAEAQQIRVATPFNQTGWAQEVEQKLAWVVTNSRQQADLVLNPPELGRIEVSVVVKGDEVSASFASPHQAVREAIEESLVRLRENLADAGINLGQTHVGRESSRDAAFARPEAWEGTGRQAGTGSGEAERPLGNTLWQPARSRGLVDVFA